MRLAFVQLRIRERAQLLESAVVEPELERARLADFCRDAGVPPVALDTFESWTAELDEEAWRRLALQVEAFGDDGARSCLPAIHDANQSLAPLIGQLVDLATRMPMHTMDLLCQSVIRTEEFARAFAANAGIAIHGETAEESAVVLNRLDYSQLLAEAEAAKLSAEDRMAYLRALQEEEEAEHFGARRGKW